MEKKTQRLTSELSDQMKNHVEDLLNRRSELKDIEETLKEEKDFYGKKFKEILNNLGVDTVVGPNSSITLTERVTKTLSEELFMKNLVAVLENYIPQRKMKEFVANFNLSAVIENSKEEKVSDPYVVFTIKKNGKK